MHGGGISIYVSQSAITAKSVNINVQLCAMICIDCALMTCSNKKPQSLRCIAYYRPPKKGQIGIDEFHDFQRCMRTVVDNSRHVIVMGDLNLPDIDWQLCVP